MAVQACPDATRSQHDSLHGIKAVLRAAHAESIERLIATAARELLLAAEAEQAGTWLLKGASSAGSPTLDGVLVKRQGGSIIEQPITLDSSFSELVLLLENKTDQALRATDGPSRSQPLQDCDLEKCFWLPIHNGIDRIGLALVAFQDQARDPDFRAIRTFLDAVALAMSFQLAGRIHSGAACSPEQSNDLRASLLEAEAQLYAVAEAAEDGIVLFDAKTNLALLNDRFAELIGIPRQALVEAKNCDGLARTLAGWFANGTDFVRKWQALAEHPDAASCDELQLLGGTRRRIERFARPITNAEGKLVGRLEVYRELKSGDILEAHPKHGEDNAPTKRFLSGLARELTGPLANIIGYSQLLLGRKLTPSQAADTSLIYQEAERATQTVKNLLSFCNDGSPVRRGVNLNHIVEESLAAGQDERQLQSVGIKLELDPDLPAIQADATRLQQAIRNLIMNAEQAMRQNARPGNISIRTHAAPGSVFLEISDSGPGIPPEIIPRIFDPFFSTRAAGSGAGLGLSVVYSIVQQYDGEISVNSEPGRGARFTIEFPSVPGLDARTDPQNRKSQLTGKTPLTRARVLVIEDEPSVAQLIADVLREEGLVTEIALDGVHGLSRALAGDFDLVICDLKMPQVNGQNIYRQLAAKDKTQLNRLVFVTGDTLSRHTMEFLESSGVPFLAKPFLVEELKLIVHRTIAMDNAANGNSVRGDCNEPPLHQETPAEKLREISHAFHTK